MTQGEDFTVLQPTADRGPSLSPADWRSGETMVIVELIAPYGGREGFERALRELVGGGK